MQNLPSHRTLQNQMITSHQCGTKHKHNMQQANMNKKERIKDKIKGSGPLRMSTQSRTCSSPCTAIYQHP
jgi:hypothetical protein